MSDSNSEASTDSAEAEYPNDAWSPRADAWLQFAAAAIANGVCSAMISDDGEVVIRGHDVAVNIADQMLAEFDKRFVM